MEETFCNLFQCDHSNNSRIFFLPVTEIDLPFCLILILKLIKVVQDKMKMKIYRFVSHDFYLLTMPV